MKDILVEQLTEMRRTLSGNIKSIEALIEAFNALGKLIEKLSKEEKDQATVASLKETQNNISGAIKDLIKHTDNLFEAYKKMVDNI